MRRHHVVTHNRGEFARIDGELRVHTNTIEGFFGLLKRAIIGVFHWVSAKHLHRYGAEHAFRVALDKLERNVIELKGVQADEEYEGQLLRKLGEL